MNNLIKKRWIQKEIPPAEIIEQIKKDIAYATRYFEK